MQMLKHAGMFESQPSMIPSFNRSTNSELQWRSWLHRESQNRYVIISATAFSSIQPIVVPTLQSVLC